MEGTPLLAGATASDGTCFDPNAIDLLTEDTMPERDPTDAKNPANAASRPRGDDRNVPQDPDVAQQGDSDSPKSTSSRPRGTTEDADRTL
jgi:hypothetical protein